jgi:Bacterial Ig domain
MCVLTSPAPGRAVLAGLMLVVLLSGCGGDSSSASPPPVTQSFDATTTIGQTVMLDVLSHVTDPGGGSLSIVSASVSNGGTATVAANGEIAFTPAPGFSGPTTVSYVVANMAGAQASGQVSVTVTPVPHRVLGGSGAGLVLLADGQSLSIGVGGPLTQVELSPSRRYVAYTAGTGDGQGLAIYDLAQEARVLGVPFGSTALFTADESQLWIRQASTPLAQPQSLQLVVARLPSGALTTVEQFGTNCGPINLAFAAADNKLFYGVACTNPDPVASGVFSIDRAGPWSPQRITASQTSASLSDTGFFAVDAAGEHLIYELAGNPDTVSSITVGNRSAALATDSCLASSGGATPLTGGDTTRAISPDGSLAFIAAPSGLCDQPGQPGVINVTTSLVSTQTAGTVYQSGKFAYTAFRGDSKQAIIAQPVSDYVVQLSAVNLTAPGDAPALIDTESAVSSTIYTDDGRWLVYIHQDSNDSSSPPRSARLYAWNTAGGSAPVRLAPDDNDFVTFFAVAADSRTVAFSTTNVSGTVQLYLVDISAPAYALPVPYSPSVGCCEPIYGVY